MIDAEAPLLLGTEQRIFGTGRRLDRDRHLAFGQPGDVGGLTLGQLRGERLLGFRRRGGLVGGAERLLETPQRVAQLEFAEHLAQLGPIGRRRDVAGDVQVDLDRALGGRQRLGHARIIRMVGQVFLALGAADLVDRVQHRLQGAEALQQVGGGLVTDSRYPRDVVAGVALEADEVRDELGRDAVAVDHPLAVIHARIGDAPRRGHDLDPLVDQLIGVAVAGHDHHLNRRVGDLGALGDRGDHVVGLKALDPQVAVAEGVDQRLQVRPLLLEQVRPARALRLVLGVDLLAAAVSPVPDHDGRLGAVVGEDLDQHRGEAEDRVGRHAGRGGDRLGQREERPVGEAVAVDQEELVGHRRLSLSRGPARPRDGPARDSHAACGAPASDPA